MRCSRRWWSRSPKDDGDRKATRQGFAWGRRGAGVIEGCPADRLDSQSRRRALSTPNMDVNRFNGLWSAGVRFPRMSFVRCSRNLLLSVKRRGDWCLVAPEAGALIAVGLPWSSNDEPFIQDAQFSCSTQPNRQAGLRRPTQERQSQWLDFHIEEAFKIYDGPRGGK